LAQVRLCFSKPEAIFVQIAFPSLFALFFGQGSALRLL